MTPTIGAKLLTMKTRKDGVQTAIDDLLKRMSQEDPLSDDYSKMMKSLQKLYKMRENPRRVSPDTIAVILGNIAVVLLIVTYEKHNVVTTKALGFMQKHR